METEGAKLTSVNAQAAKDSWLSPEQPNEDKLCYAETPDGKEQIYKTDDAVDQKREEAQQTALKWLEKAGYTVEDGSSCGCKDVVFNGISRWNGYSRISAGHGGCE